MFSMNSDNPLPSFLALMLFLSALVAGVFLQGCAAPVSPTDPEPVSCGAYDPNRPDTYCKDLGGGKYQCAIADQEQPVDSIPPGTDVAEVCAPHNGDMPPPCTLWLYCTPIK